MKISYIWFDSPGKQKIYDTENGYKEHLKFSKFLKMEPMTMQEFNHYQLMNFKLKKEKGYVLTYAIMEV